MLLVVGFAELAYSQNYDYDDDVDYVESYDDAYDYDYDYEAEVVDVNEKIAEQKEARSFKTNLKKRYNSRDFDYTDKRKESKPIETNSSDDVFSVVGGILNVLGYLVLILIVAFVIRAFVLDGGAISRKGKKVKGLYEVVDDQVNFEEYDYNKLAREAADLNEWKMAVRYYFLAYLQKLYADEIIEYHRDKTNREYRYEISDPTERNQFDVLCRVFEYCWYGERDLTQEQFRNAEQIFKEGLKK